MKQWRLFVPRAPRLGFGGGLLTLCAELSALGPPLLVPVLTSSGCAVTGGQTGDEWTGSTKEVHSNQERLRAQGTPNNAAAEDERQFTWELYAVAADASSNTVFSPLSISLASAMLLAGAAGDTKTEIQSALHLSSDGDAFYQAQNTLLQALDARNRVGSDSENAQSLKLSNDAWILAGQEPKQAYLDILGKYFGLGLNLARFSEDPDGARRAINRKVETDTAGLIPDLLPDGVIDPLTRLVLTNALYVKGSWQTPFVKSATQNAPFYAENGSVDVPLMRVETELRYLKTDAYSAVAIPLSSAELELIAIMPTAGTFSAFSQSLNAASVATIIADAETTPLKLALPKFKLQATWDLSEQLDALGMHLAFDAGKADFTPIGITTDLYVAHMPHQAVLSIDEEGLEAAAATAVVLNTKHSVTPATESLTLDHPFIFVLRDVESGANLFVGHYVQPE